MEYAKKRDLPKINKGMGIGIQVLGERFATHQLIVEKLSERFLAQDPKVNRSKAFEVLQFNNIFLGKTEGKVRVPGLAAAKVDLSDPNILYYNLCLGAIVTLPGVKNSAHMMNAAAASLTALAEQTILVTKQTTFMPKSALLEEEKKKPVSIYVQPRIQDFLKTLSRAEENLYASCGLKPATDPYKMLAQASSNGKPIKSDSPEGIEVLNLVTPLAFDPTVTADVFFYSGRSDKAFLQWAIGPFEVEYTVGKNKTATGMEMVFFEGWHDTIRPGSKKPMTNDEWRAAFEQGQYKELGSLVLGKRSGRR